MSAIELAKNVYWVGVKDPQLKIFDIIMPLENGTTYNAYLIKGEKVALIDTVKKGFTEEYFANIEQIVPLASVDYLIINHNEPDHSGSFEALLERAPNAKLICSASAVPFVRNILNTEAEITGIKDDFQLDLGGKTLTFKLTPYMHWPDTMMEFLIEDGILFSCDGFAPHVCADSIFADEVDEDIDHEFKYYFDAIMRPFAGYIRRNLPKLDGFDIKMVAPSHGTIFREDARKYIDRYRDWTVDKTEGKNQVAVFYASSYGNTEMLARTIAGSLEKQGFTAPLAEITKTGDDDAKELIESSKAVLVGTPTFAGDAVQPVWNFVNLFSTVYSIGKKAAVFGSYGWGGEASKLVADRLAGLKLKVFEEPFRARLVPSDEDMTAIDEYCQKLAEFLNK